MNSWIKIFYFFFVILVSYFCTSGSMPFKLLFRPRKWLQSIVMSMSVCVSVCLQRYLWNHKRNLFQIFCACCLWPWLADYGSGPL